MGSQEIFHNNIKTVAWKEVSRHFQPASMLGQLFLNLLALCQHPSGLWPQVQIKSCTLGMAYAKALPSQGWIKRSIPPCRPTSVFLCSLSTSNCSAQAEYLEREGNVEDKIKRQQEGDFAIRQYWLLLIINRHWLLYELGSFILE